VGADYSSMLAMHHIRCARFAALVTSALGHYEEVLLAQAWSSDSGVRLKLPVLVALAVVLAAGGAPAE
jgi:hypothetical protein